MKSLIDYPNEFTNRQGLRRGRQQENGPEMNFEGKKKKKVGISDVLWDAWIFMQMLN
jgi:hypothetical protein